MMSLNTYTKCDTGSFFVGKVFEVDSDLMTMAMMTADGNFDVFLKTYIDI